nr:60S acidic ribosomal protein P1 [Tanacetum cinerariifolium]
PGRLVCGRCVNDDDSTLPLSIKDHSTWGVILNFQKDELLKKTIQIVPLKEHVEPVVVSVPTSQPSLFAKLAEKKNIEDLILNADTGDGGAPAVGAFAGGGAAAAAPAAEENKESLTWSVGCKMLSKKRHDIGPLAVKGLSECKASESNVRRIQVKDIIKEVEDHLKTYSSAGMDIS